MKSFFFSLNFQKKKWKILAKNFILIMICTFQMNDRGKIAAIPKFSVQNVAELFKLSTNINKKQKKNDWNNLNLNSAVLT